MSKIKAVIKQVLLLFYPVLRTLVLYENLVKKHCTIGVVSPPSFMRRIVLAIFWAEYWGRSPGQRIDIQEKLMGGAAGADWA